jgi:hypothetical protein
MSDALLDLDPEGNAAQAQRMQLNAIDVAPTPDVFQNFGGAVGNHAMRAAANVGRTVAILASAPAVAIEKMTAGDNYSGSDNPLSGPIFKAVDDYFNPSVDYWTPNAAQTGKAGKIVGGLVEGIAPLALGPAGVPAMLGNAQVGTSTDLMREGVDADTALKVGLADSASNAAGFKVPFLGKTLASRVVSGASGNLAVNSSASLVQNKTLEGSGYAEAAKQFDPTDTEARALDVLMGAAFGVVTHASVPRPTVSQGDAVLATRNAKNFQQDSAPGVPKDVASSVAHQANMEQAMLQLMRGEKVDLSSTIQEADFLKPPEAMRETHVATAVREAIADVRPDGAPVLPLSGPRGVRNNNPGNIEKSATAWQGKVDGTDPRFETFATPELGIRALAKNLLTSQDRHGNNTITDIINRWAPAKENNTAAYVAAVAKETGLDPTAVLNLSDPETLQKLTTAIIHHENGVQPYGDDIVRAGVDLALSGRTATTPELAYPNGIVGADTSAITERGQKIALQYLVSEANDLITSHDNNLKPNPDFPAELQPRDRERSASEAQITRIENGIQPELLAESPKASDGAPIIGRDGVVESGNARTIALRRAYDNGKAVEYKQWLIDNAGRFGLDSEALAKMNRPVLTRVGLESYDRAEFARQANESSVAHMSSTEIAQSDAARMPDLHDLHTNDDGSINVASSMPFVRAFINDAVSPSERGSMMTASGDLSQDGVRRIRNAVFAKAYGDPDIVAMMGESTDANVKNILNGMMRAAPEVARMRDLIEAGARQPLDIGPALVQAVRQFSKLRSEGRTVDQHMAQHSLIDSPVSPEVNNLLISLQETSRAPRRVADLITSYTDKLHALGDPRQQGMFGDAVPAANDLMADLVEGLRTEPKSTLPATPEIEAMRKIIQEDPNATVLDGYNADGNPVYTRMSEAAANIEAEHTEQLKEAQSYGAVVNCLLRRGG